MQRVKTWPIAALLPVLALLVLGLFAGCGNEINDEYEAAATAPGGDYHPFDGFRQHDDYMFATDYDFTQCTECHGEELKGVELGDPENPVRDCTRCHTRDRHDRSFDGVIGADGDGGFENAFGHVQWMKDNEYNVEPCQTCHSNVEDESIVTFGSSCGSGNGCHPTEDGFQSCNTCHGDFDGDPNDLLNWAPESGAHMAHLQVDGNEYRSMACNVCHKVPGTWDAEGHFNDDTPGQAEIDFGGRGALGSRGEWAPVSETCSNTYCHGDNVMDWNLRDLTFDCDSCHGFPPTRLPSHPNNDNCGECHSTVDPDDNMNIIHPEQHMNGALELN